jgi:type IV pilus assembly protein PilB
VHGHGPPTNGTHPPAQQPPPDPVPVQQPHPEAVPVEQPHPEAVAAGQAHADAGIKPPSPSGNVRRRLGDVIVELGFADRNTVEAAVVEAQETGRQTGQVLLSRGAVDSRQLAHALAERNQLEYVDLNTFEVDKGAANLISADEARRYRVIPVSFLDEGTLLVACAEPENVVGLDDVRLATGYDVRAAVSAPEDIEALIGQLSRLGDSVHEIEDAPEEEDAGQAIELRESAEQAPVVKLVHSIIADAVERGASDIHFEPRNGDMRVRMRVDGVAIDSTTVPKKLAASVVSRVKIMAQLDIAERRLPHDGRVGLTVDGRLVDLRVATLPVVRGESIVMRILDTSQVMLDLDVLGMEAHERDALRGVIGRIHGAVLVTGPTGAGKTTTLYAALSEVNTPERTLVTIEDPVEYELDGVKQVQVNPKAGLTFATGLRSMVRSDPDVMMVGEIRDRETAQIAIESALTGHLVLSTMHTNDAPMAAARLIDMGIEPFLIASGLECVVAQRLARRLCEDCRRPVRLSGSELELHGFPGADIDAYEPVGCVRCGDTGYSGRIGIYEIMVFSEELRGLILKKASRDEIAEAARAGGMQSMRETGFDKVRAGVTSVAELLRVVGT